MRSPPPNSRRHHDDVVRSRYRDHARDLISAVFSPHTLEVLGPAGDLDVYLRARRTPSITIAELRHGTEVLVRPGALESYFEINMPVRGHTVSAYGQEEIESGPGRAVILSPTRSSSMRWSGDCAQLAVKISRALVERTLEGVLGYPPDEVVQFAVGFDVTAGGGRAWAQAATMLRDALDTEAPDLVVRPLEELVVGQLLATQPHNFADRIDGGVRPARPRTVARVLERIDGDPAEAYTLADMAGIAGTSVRSLQAAFAQHLGLSPMAYLRRVRLARAHQDLQSAAPGSCSVADIAYRWGFGHVPRFAAAYRERYGVAPSQTLRS